MPQGIPVSGVGLTLSQQRFGASGQRPAGVTAGLRLSEQEITWLEGGSGFGLAELPTCL